MPDLAESALDLPGRGRQRGKGAAGPAPPSSRFGANVQLPALARRRQHGPAAPAGERCPRPPLPAGLAARLRAAAAADRGEAVALAAAPVTLGGLENLGKPD